MKTLLFFTLLLVGCSSSTQSTTTQPTTECGVERWHVKNLLDPDTASINFHPDVSSIAALELINKISAGTTTPRLDFEKVTVRLYAKIVAYKKEDDGDIHLLLEDGKGGTMIAEIPNAVDCNEIAQSGHAAQYRNAATWVRSNLGSPTTNFKNCSRWSYITGVLFQDFSHGQRDEASNSVELHPVLFLE